MTDNALLIIGAGGNGRVVADVAASTQRFSRIAFLDDDRARVEKARPWEVIGPCDDFGDHTQEFSHVFVGFGDNGLRSSWIERIVDSRFELATIVAPSSYVSPHSVLGAGTVVMPASAVNIGVSMGTGCLINTGATVDHDCLLGDTVHVSPGANLGGGVSVGARSWIGIGAAGRQEVTIGSDVMVGAGAAVVTDLPDDCTAIGVPAHPHPHTAVT